MQEKNSWKNALGTKVSFGEKKLNKILIIQDKCSGEKSSKEWFLEFSELFLEIFFQEKIFWKKVIWKWLFWGKKEKKYFKENSWEKDSEN